MTSIDKPAIFVASTGRTGTQFLGGKMRRMIGHCHSIHEADVLWVNRPGEWLHKIRQFGLYRMTLGKSSPRYSLRALGFARATGRLADDRAVEYLKNIRGPYIESVDEGVFLEANSQYALLIDLLPRAFPNSRLVFIVRDPREWVRSWMSMENSLYTVTDLRSWLLGGRLKPKFFPTDPYRGEWKRMDHFEKLCWLWQKENDLALGLVADLPQARVFRFEELFTGSEKYTAFHDMLGFVTRFPNGFKADWELRTELLERKVHPRSQGGFPAWGEWDSTTARKMDRLCGPLMARLGYGNEPAWKRLTG